MAGFEAMAAWQESGCGSPSCLRHFLPPWTEGRPKLLSSPFLYTEEPVGSKERGALPAQPSPPHLLRLRGTCMLEACRRTQCPRPAARLSEGAARVTGSWTVAGRDGVSLVRLACLALAGKHSQPVRWRNVAWTKPGSLHSVKSRQGPNGSRGLVGPVAHCLSISCGTPPTPPFLPS